MMKDLSKSACIEFTVDAGPYYGMKCTDAATAEYTGPLLGTMVAIEKVLEASSGSSSTASDAKCDVNLVLADSTLQRLEKIAKVNHFPPGMELELQIRSSQYLLDQAM